MTPVARTVNFARRKRGMRRVRVGAGLERSTTREADDILTRRYRRIGISVERGAVAGQPDASVWVAHFSFRC